MNSFDIYSGRIRVRASALVLQEGCIVLVQQEVPTRDHLVWIPPGGGIQLGESAEDALVREVFEETGLRVVPSHLRYVHEFIQGDFHTYELYFICDNAGGELKTGSDPEHSLQEQLIVDVQWVPVEKLSEIELFPQFLGEEAANDTIFTDAISHFKTT